MRSKLAWTKLTRSKAARCELAWNKLARSELAKSEVVKLILNEVPLIL